MQWGSRGVLVLLVALSIWSVAIMFDRSGVFRELEKSDDFDEAKRLIRDRNWDGLGQWANGRETLGAGVIRAAIETRSKEPGQIDRSVRSFLTERRGVLEKGLTVLTTL